MIVPRAGDCDECGGGHGPETNLKLRLVSQAALGRTKSLPLSGPAVSHGHGGLRLAGKASATLGPGVTSRLSLFHVRHFHSTVLLIFKMKE